MAKVKAYKVISACSVAGKRIEPLVIHRSVTDGEIRKVSGVVECPVEEAQALGERYLVPATAKEIEHAKKAQVFVQISGNYKRPVTAKSYREEQEEAAKSVSKNMTKEAQKKEKELEAKEKELAEREAEIKKQEEAKGNQNHAQ